MRGLAVQRPFLVLVRAWGFDVNATMQLFPSAHVLQILVNTA
jgi:hypothetical protein